MREIGSEFWETETDFASLTGRKTYLAGRTALTAVIVDMKSRGIKKVSLPDYCCESMIEPFLRQDMKFAFYPIRKSDSGMECLLESSSDCEAVMLVNYFGFMSRNMKSLIRECRQAGKTVILDQTHAVFTDDQDYQADYIFGSYRKWTGLEAGFVSCRNERNLITWPFNQNGLDYLSLRNHARKTKALFVNDDYKDEVLRSEQLSLFEKAEKLLDREYLSDTDDVNKFLLNSLDKVSITEQRKKNARIIYSWLSRLRLCKPVFPVLGEEVIPLTVPILVSEGRRNSLRVYLREHGVFCPIHWSLSPLHKSGEGALQVFRNEVSLVCDQRYEESDMVRMMEVVEKWEKSHPHDRDWFC